MSEYFKPDFALGAKFQQLMVCIIAVALVGCGSGDGDDLDQYMRDATKNVKPKVKPLPEVKPYSALQYNADGSLVDPFRPRKAISKSSALQPNMSRPKEPMEAYPLESLQYVGMLSRKKLTYALIKTPDNSIQQVRVGNYVGQNFGKIEQISDSEVVLKEIVQDDISGDWIERTSNLLLQE